MKVSRFKKSHRTLTFFATNFNYREPYQVLIDGTFCQAALQNKIIIDEQLKKYFQSVPKLLTTQCIILEAESLGPPLTGATMIVKKFYVHKCGHEGKPVSAAECIKTMTKESRYIVASQDRSLQASLRKVPGRCLLYLHKATPVLEAPSDASKKYVIKKSKNFLPEKVEQRIEFMKKKEGIQNKSEHNLAQQKKVKTRKNPNPLSCKKSKKEKIQKSTSTKSDRNEISVQITTPMKAKRKRTKLPTHIKAVLQNTS